MMARTKTPMILEIRDFLPDGLEPGDGKLTEETHELAILTAIVHAKRLIAEEFVDVVICHEDYVYAVVKLDVDSDEFSTAFPIPRTARA